MSINHANFIETQIKIMNQIAANVHQLSVELNQLKEEWRTKMEIQEESSDRRHLKMVDKINAMEIKTDTIVEEIKTMVGSSNNNRGKILSTTEATAAETILFDNFRTKHFTKEILNDYCGNLTNQFKEHMK
jgi:hypothetical protein